MNNTNRTAIVLLAIVIIAMPFAILLWGSSVAAAAVPATLMALAVLLRVVIGADSAR